MSFEESMKKLEQFSEKIRDDRTTLDEAIKCYEEGVKCYNECSSILKNAEQKIEIFNRKEASEE